MLTHARALEMYITCCKMLRVKYYQRDTEAYASFDAAIRECIKWLDDMEKVK